MWWHNLAQVFLLQQSLGTSDVIIRLQMPD
jgi:hypothetical protein